MSFLAALINKYPEVPLDILKGYKEPDRYFIMNEGDPDLHPIYIELRQDYPENLREVEGFGLPAIEQKFKRQVMPKRLQKLIKERETIDEIWLFLEENMVDYYEEIEWVRQQWHYRLNGYWCFIRGKLTYITGSHFVYCNYWTFAGGVLPYYRDKDRRFYHFLFYTHTTTEAPIFVNGKIQYEDRYIVKRAKMFDTGQRTCLGIDYPKGRKDGATNKILCDIFCDISTLFRQNAGIVADSGKKSKEIFSEILIPAWREMPFFFKPRTTGFENPAKALEFEPVKRQAGASKVQDGLYSRITYSDSAKGTDFDGPPLYRLLVDETGKVPPGEANILKRHEILKRTVTRGNGAVYLGYMDYPSTVGELHKDGGEAFYKLAQMSHFEHRDILGKTMSGLINGFFPSWDNLEGFVDEYGDTVMNDPLVPVMGENGNMIKFGSKDFLNNRRKMLAEQGDMALYNEEVRLYPIFFRECFRTEAGDIGFNTKKMGDRLDQLKFAKNKEIRIGDFKRKNGDKDSKVEWVDNPSGRWEISLLLSQNEADNRYLDGNSWVPKKSKFTCGADTFGKDKIEAVEHGRKGSLGGGSIFWDYDETIDGKKDISEYLTERFVAIYLYRPPTKEEFCEDMLSACCYYNSMMYPENDIDAIAPYFEKRGYGRYLKYDYDFTTRKFKNNPGYSTNRHKLDLFNHLRTHIEQHVQREVHIRLIQQWNGITGIDEMTKYDLVACSGGALRGSNIVVSNDIEKEKLSKKVRDNWFRKKKVG